MIETQKLIDNYIYFYHVDKFCVIPVYPENVTDNLQSNFTSTNALSRSAPVFSYNNSGPRTITLNFSLHRDLMNDVNRNVSNLKDNVVSFQDDDYIDTLIKYLQSVALPRYKNYSTGSKSVIPPMIAVRFGNEIFIKGVVNGGINVTYKSPILYNSKYACVDIAFTISESDPYDADTVIADGSFRGITRTFKDGIYKSTTSSPTINKMAQSASTNSDSLAKSIVNTRNGLVKQQKKQTQISGNWHTSSTGTTHGGHGGSWGEDDFNSNWHTSSSGTTHGGHGGSWGTAGGGGGHSF